MTRYRVTRVWELDAQSPAEAIELTREDVPHSEIHAEEIPSRFPVPAVTSYEERRCLAAVPHPLHTHLMDRVVYECPGY